MCCLVKGEGGGWWRIIHWASILSREEYYGFSLSCFRLLLASVTCVQLYLTLLLCKWFSFFLSCRDISFLYDAGASGRTGLDSAGKSLITPGSEKSKGSMGSKQRETVMKSKDDNNQEAMVHSLMNNALKRKNWFAQGSELCIDGIWLSRWLLVLRSDQLLVSDFLTSRVEVIFIDFADDLCSGSWHSNLYPLTWVLFHDLHNSQVWFNFHQVNCLKFWETLLLCQMLHVRKDKDFMFRDHECWLNKL